MSWFKTLSLLLLLTVTACGDFSSYTLRRNNQIAIQVATSSGAWDNFTLASLRIS